MPFDYSTELSKSDNQKRYDAADSDLLGRESQARTRYGVKADGSLDWSENQVNPFSVTAQLSKLFRQQNDAQKYGSFAGGWGSAGVSGFEAANLASGQQKTIYDTTNTFNDQTADFARERAGNIDRKTTGDTTLDIQAQQAFANNPDATTGVVGDSASGLGAVGYQPSGAPQPNLVKRYSAAHKADWYFKVGASGKLIPVRPA